MTLSVVVVCVFVLGSQHVWMSAASPQEDQTWTRTWRTFDFADYRHIPPHLKGEKISLKRGLPFRFFDRLELTLVFEARDLNSVIQQAVRSEVWRNLRWRKLHLARTACDNQSRHAVAFAFIWKDWKEFTWNSATNWIRYRATKNYFRHQEMDSRPLWCIQHAIMTLKNPSGVEIMTAETLTTSR